jgi:hypothetical protein
MKPALAVSILAALLACAVTATAGPNEDCTDQRATSTVQRLIYQRFLSPTYRAQVPDTLFRDGTVVKLA